MSNKEWNFKTKDDGIYIENMSKNKVLGITDHGKVIQEDFKENNPGQLWRRGEPDAEGYFKLEMFKVPKVLTATSAKSLEIKGNYEIH